MLTHTESVRACPIKRPSDLYKRPLSVGGTTDWPGGQEGKGIRMRYRNPDKHEFCCFKERSSIFHSEERKKWNQIGNGKWIPRSLYFSLSWHCNASSSRNVSVCRYKKESARLVLFWGFYDSRLNWEFELLYRARGATLRQRERCSKSTFF